ncbi:Uncharacterized membrane anchored protein Mext_4159 [hydrothermal vent metagenome]|uniref:Uncharacterized membrane anchored protein Mext_4159 n=1 Tax=hydrothermal vent metagenome TaxID=652676 RepID=A0A3B1DPS2_9ZZZZ
MFNNLKKYFLSGLVIFLPIALTAYLLYLGVTTIDGILAKFIEPYFLNKFGFYFRGISFFLGIYIIIVIGFFARNLVGHRIHQFFEKLLLKLPFFRQVYPALKEMAVFLFSQEQLKSFKQVVLVEYPRKGAYAFGFLTGEKSADELCAKTGQNLCNVFVPSAPGPLTGFIVLFPKEEVIFTDITIEEAFKFILSGGVVNPN